MKGFFSQALAFLEFWLKKEDQYSQHSPFVFTLYEDLRKYLVEYHPLNLEIENYRKILLQNSSLIDVEDLGAGSKRVNHHRREIRQIAKFSTSSPKFSMLYQYFCQLTPARNVLELGTCLGISTRYLSVVTQGKLWTIEGSKEIWETAKSSPCPDNTTFLLGNIDQLLPELLPTISPIDFVLIDANHTYEGTLNSFHRCISHIHPGSILILGDIHWSGEMEQSWREIKNHPSVRLTIDFFECGVVFFDYPGSKAHLILDI